MSNYKVSLAAITIPDETESYMLDMLRSGNIGQNSKYITQFEEQLKEYAGTKHAIVTSCGTVADAIAVAAMKEKYHPRRVVVPALTFIAQINSVYYNGLDIEFVDVTEDFVMNWEEAGLFDNHWTIYFPSDCLGRNAIDWTYGGTRIIEDACEAFGSMLDGSRAGTGGEIGTFSFFVSHVLTCGEGGAIITDDDYLANLCRSLRSHGRASDSDARYKFSHPYIGFNGKMSAPQAVLGCALMNHVDEYTKRRHANYLKFQQALGGFPERDGERIIPHGFPVEFDNEMDRNRALTNLLNSGIECRKFFSCIPTMESAYKHLRIPLGRFPVAEHIAYTYLYVPCHHQMCEAQVEFVINAVKEQEGRVRKEQLAYA